MSDNKHGEHLKNETAPEAPELREDSNLHKAPKKNKPWVAALAKFSRPLAAIVVVIGLAAVGYYGFIRSSADSLSFTPPSCVNPGSAKCEERTKAALQDFKASCKAAHLDYNGSSQSCGSCVDGYKKVNGACQQKERVNCTAQYRVNDGPYDCGRCVDGFAQNGDGKCQLKIPCGFQNRVQRNDFECGRCVDGYGNSAGTCKKEVDCKPLNRVQADAFTCGACKTNFSEVAGKCASNTQMANLCAAAFKKYDPATGSCTTCLNGYKLSGAACVRDTTVTVTKADCDALHRTFGTNKCGPCVAGYTATSNNACYPSAGGLGALSCKAGEVFVDNKCQKSVEATCDAQHKQYAREKNVCREACQTGYYPSANKTCVPIVRTQVDPNVKAQCDAAHQVYDKLSNSCTKTCVDGYYLKDKACVVIPNKVEDCNRDVTGRCSVDVKTMKAICAGQFREYNERTNACRQSCIEGYYTRDGVCKKAGEGNPKQVKANCEKQNLTYDAEANLCKPNCKADYVMRDGACVKWEDVTMSATRCNALGRVWMPAVPATETTAAIAGSCTTTCKDPENTTYVDKNNTNVNYCEAKASANGVAGVSTDMKKEECQKANRAWIEAINACSARCKTGYFFSVSKNECVVIVAAVDPNLQGTGDEGNGTTDGCEADLQEETYITNSGKTVTILVCPDDGGEVTPPVATEDGTAVRHNVDTTLTREACRLLGRAWVPKGDKGEAAGCSTQACRNDDFKVVANKDDGTPYCQGSIDTISKKKCEALHRIWSPMVGGCVSAPGQNSGSKATVDAPQCVAPYTVYIYHPASQGGGECVKPTTYERFKSVANKLGKPVGAVINTPARSLCAVRANMQWVDGKCVKKRVPVVQTSSTSGSGTSTTTSGGSTSTGGTSSGGSSNGCREGGCGPTGGSTGGSNGCREGGCGPVGNGGCQPGQTRIDGTCGASDARGTYNNPIPVSCASVIQNTFGNTCIGMPNCPTVRYSSNGNYYKGPACRIGLSTNPAGFGV